MNDAVSTWVIHQLAEEALADVLGALQAAGVQAVAVKGIVLAQTLYADVADRPIQDVDLRIARRDLGRAIDAARARGWELDHSSRQTGAVGLRHPRMLVELETTIGPPGMCAMPVEDVIARARPRRRPSGVVCLEPEVHDHALLLVVNAFKDKIVLCPRWSVRDLVTLAGLPGFDHDTFLARVREAHAVTMTAIVARHLAGRSDAWRTLAARLGPPPRRLYALACHLLFARAPMSPLSRALTRAGADRLRDRAYALGATVVGAAAALRHGRALVDPRPAAQ